MIIPKSSTCLCAEYGDHRSLHANHLADTTYKAIFGYGSLLPCLLHFAYFYSEWLDGARLLWLCRLIARMHALIVRVSVHILYC